MTSLFQDMNQLCGNCAEISYSLLQSGTTNLQPPLFASGQAILPAVTVQKCQ